MAKITIRIDPRTGLCYIPKSIRREGFINKVELLANALTVTLVKPGTELSDVDRSLELLRQDIALRCRQEEVVDHNKKNERGSPKLPVKQEESAPRRAHPLFHKYTRDWLSEVTSYSKGYLSRVATGKIPLSRSFVERVCFSLDQPEAELFIPGREENVA